MLKNQNGQKDQASGKNIFSRAIESVESSSFLLVIFRWRYTGCLQPESPEALCGDG